MTLVIRNSLTAIREINDDTFPDVKLETESNQLSPRSQAERVIAKFGGARALSRALTESGKKRDPATIFRWTYPKSKGGCGGRIPNHAWESVLVAARHAGIFLTLEDFDPRPRLMARKEWFKIHNAPSHVRKTHSKRRKREKPSEKQSTEPIQPIEPTESATPSTELDADIFS